MYTIILFLFYLFQKKKYNSVHKCFLHHGSSGKKKAIFKLLTKSYSVDFFLIQILLHSDFVKNDLSDNYITR